MAPPSFKVLFSVMIVVLCWGCLNLAIGSVFLAVSTISTILTMLAAEMTGSPSILLVLIVTFSTLIVRSTDPFRARFPWRSRRT